MIKLVSFKYLDASALGTRVKRDNAISESLYGDSTSRMAEWKEWVKLCQCMKKISYQLVSDSGVGRDSGACLVPMGLARQRVGQLRQSIDSPDMIYLVPKASKQASVYQNVPISKHQVWLRHYVDLWHDSDITLFGRPKPGQTCYQLIPVPTVEHTWIKTFPAL